MSIFPLLRRSFRSCTILSQSIKLSSFFDRDLGNVGKGDGNGDEKEDGEGDREDEKEDGDEDKGGDDGDGDGNKTELPANSLTHLFEDAENLDNTKESLTKPPLPQKLVILGVPLEALASTLEVPNLR